MKRLPALLGCLTLSAVMQAAAQSVPEWRFVEELRIGSEKDDPTGLSDVRGLLVDKKGNIWVIEASTQEIRIFDPAGKFLRSVGRKGQGPGEFLYPDGMAMAPNGQIWVHDPQNGRFSIFDQDGKFVRQQLAVSNGFGYVWSGGIDGRGQIWDWLLWYDPKQPFANRVRRANPDWSRVDTLDLPECHVPGASPENAQFAFPGGRILVPYYPQPVTAMEYDAAAIWCAPSSAEYQLVKIGIDKKGTLATIKGAGKPLSVTQKERDSAIARVEEFRKRVGGASVDYSRIPRTKPILQAAFVDEEGRLWVERTSQANVVFEIYSGLGKPVARLTLPYPVSIWRRPVIRNGTAWFVVQEEGEIPYIIRGRIGPLH